MKLKIYNLLKPLGTIIQQNYWSFYTSELIYFAFFTMRHPVFVVSFFVHTLTNEISHLFLAGMRTTFLIDGVYLYLYHKVNNDLLLIKGTCAQPKAECQNYVCPTNDANYRLIGGQCYFFSTQDIDYDAQQSLCATKFGTCGRLFEPCSLTASDEVSDAVNAASLGSTYYFIGINDRISNDVLAYESTGTSVSMTIPWVSGQPSYSVPNGDCAAISTVKTWPILSCPAIDMAIYQTA